MIPLPGRTVGYFNEKTVLETKILEYNSEGGSEEFLFEVTKVVKDDYSQRYVPGMKIHDARKIGEESMESGFSITLDEI